MDSNVEREHDDRRQPHKRPPARIASARDLDVYRAAYALAMDIFRLSAAWPSEEKYALTGQVRRSSRSVCANLAEAWAKRRYQAHFLSKLTDADAENNETAAWLDFALDCGYMNAATHEELSDRNRRVGKMLGAMIKNPKGFIINTQE